VIVVIVVVIVPIVFGVPLVVVLAPPAMIVLPAVTARFIEFRAILGSFGAVPAMMSCSLMQFVVGMGDALLAIVIRA
jgi:hypothetical protein